MPDFPIDYELPPGLIAQEPIEPRDQARLLVLHRHDHSLEHRHFFELADLLAPGDLLVLNDTRVLHARLRGHRQATGGKWEGLFLRALTDGCWEMLCQTGGWPRPGERIVVPAAPMELVLEEKLEGGAWRVRPLVEGSPPEILERAGEVPLPPYIRGGRAW